jgi:hypothetical protein
MDDVGRAPDFEQIDTLRTCDTNLRTAARRWEASQANVRVIDFSDVPKGNNKGHVDVSDVMETNKETLTCYGSCGRHMPARSLYGPIQIHPCFLWWGQNLVSSSLCRKHSSADRVAGMRDILWPGMSFRSQKKKQSHIRTSDHLASPCFLEDEVCLNNRTCVPTAGNQKPGLHRSMISRECASEFCLWAVLAPTEI